MPMGTPEQVAALRSRLWDAGFHPVEVINHDADHPSAGKAPVRAGWQAGGAPGPVSATALNTGILCTGLRAIDIDVDNPTLAAAIKAKVLDLLGEAPMRYRRNSPRVLFLFRAAEGAPPKRSVASDLGKVEVLGRGQQFVGFGVHASGADLEWMPEAPGATFAESLPAITEDQVTTLLAACAETLGAPSEKRTNGEHHTGGRLGADALQVIAALCGIPNPPDLDWDGWNRIGMATWAATGGSDAGRAAFHAWSQQHSSYSAAATDERWDRYATSPPTKIGAGTLFYLAREAAEPPVEPDGYYDTIDDTIPPETQTAPETGIPILFWDDIQPNLDAADFVEGALTDAGMSVVYGPSNSGKTFFVADMALHVAAGLTWNGREVEQGAVIWLAMEGAFGIKNRISAWRQERLAADAPPIPFAVVPVALNLLHPDGDTRPLIAAVKAAAIRLGVPIRLIVIDTLSRAIAGGNENAPDDMGALVTNGSRIQQEVNAHVLWIHHSGKDEAKGARGHSLLRAATDTEIEIAADGAQRVATVTKQRELDCSGSFPFTLQVVELGENRRGKPVTSCVVEYTTGEVIRPRMRLDGHKKRAFDVLTDIMANGGRTGDAGVPSGYPSVPEKWWRDRFIESAMPGATPEAKRKAFMRAAGGLVDERIVGLNQGRVWVWKAENEGE